MIDETDRIISAAGLKYARMIGNAYGAWVGAGSYACGSDPLEIRDAMYECEHGNLPLDKVRGCECWGKW